MDACAQLRTVTLDVHRCHTIAGIERCFNRARCVAEDGHETVAKPLHDLAASRQDRRLDGFAHLAEESDGELVSRFQRPLGEAHEVREKDRDIHFTSTSTLSLGKSLPALENRSPKLSRDAGLRCPQGRELTKCDVGGAATNTVQPVVDLLLAECPLTRPPRRVQQLGAPVEPTGSLGEPPRATGA